MSSLVMSSAILFLQAGFIEKILETRGNDHGTVLYYPQQTGVIEKVPL